MPTLPFFPHYLLHYCHYLQCHEAEQVKNSPFGKPTLLLPTPTLLLDLPFTSDKDNLTIAEQLEQAQNNVFLSPIIGQNDSILPNLATFLRALGSKKNRGGKLQVHLFFNFRLARNSFEKVETMPLINVHPPIPPLPTPLLTPSPPPTILSEDEDDMEDECYDAEGESSDKEDNTFSIISEEPIPSHTFSVGSPLFQHEASACTAWELPAIDPFEFHTHTSPRYLEVPFDEQSFNGFHSFQTSNVRTPLFPPHKFDPDYASPLFNHAYNSLYWSVLYSCTIKLRSTILQNICEECDLNSEPGDTNKFLCFPPSIYHARLLIYPYRVYHLKKDTSYRIWDLRHIHAQTNAAINAIHAFHTPNKQGNPFVSGYFYPGC